MILSVGRVDHLPKSKVGGGGISGGKKKGTSISGNPEKREKKGGTHAIKIKGKNPVAPKKNKGKKGRAVW